MFAPFIIVLAGLVLCHVNSLLILLPGQRNLGRILNSKGPRLGPRLHGHTGLMGRGASILERNPDQKLLSVTNGLQLTTFMATCAGKKDNILQVNSQELGVS